MKQKVSFFLEDKEIDILYNLIEKAKDAPSLLSQASLIRDKDNENEFIKHKVYLALSDISGFDYAEIKDTHDLKSDLGLSLSHKRALKNFFQNIASELNFTKTISVKECEELKKVSDCLNLVKSKK